MKATRYMFAAAAALLFTSAASAQTLQVDVVFRDFIGTGTTAPNQGSAIAHPDFEFDSGFVNDVNNQDPFDGLGTSIIDAGIVQTTLGIDGVPVHTGGPTPVNTTNNNAALFDSWFKDDPTFNTTINSTLGFEFDEGLGLFVFDTTEFFPINGQGFGNTVDDDGLLLADTTPLNDAPEFSFNVLGDNDVQEGPNYHFTMHINAEFDYLGGEVFNFTGDDDLWVFIDGELVVDGGGLHKALDGSVALDDLGFTLETTHEIDIFFAERHQNDSVFRIETSILFGDVIAPIPAPAALPAGLALLGLMGLRRNRK